MAGVSVPSKARSTVDLPCYYSRHPNTYLVGQRYDHRDFTAFHRLSGVAPSIPAQIAGVIPLSLSPDTLKTKTFQ